MVWIKDKAYDSLVRLVRFATHENLCYELRRQSLTQSALTSSEPGVCDTRYLPGSDVVVSLTTYGKRLGDVYLPIEGVMGSGLKPNRIILWLAEDLRGVTLPHTLQRQMKRGLEVRFCRDIKSYKKLIPTMLECPLDHVVTLDDDIIYRFDVVENLVRACQRDDGFVYCTRAHRIRLNDKGIPLPYNSWDMVIDDDLVSPLTFPTGGGGTIYPPKERFDDELFNEEVFMDICRGADDVWFKAMELLSGIPVRKVVSQQDSLLFSEFNQETALRVANVELCQNDIYLKAVFSRYGLYEKLKG